MKFGVAVWSYCTPKRNALELIEQAASMGCQVVSLLPSQVAGLPPRERQALADKLRALKLEATVHGNCEMTDAEIAAVVGTLGARLLCFTADAAKTEDSRGRFFDAPPILRTLRRIRQETQGTRVRFGVEDFPLDRAALDFYGGELAELFRDERAGVLIDLGHMHLKRSGAAYFKKMTAADYLGRVPLEIIEVHVHDNDGKKDQHAGMGCGTVPFREVGAALRTLGFDGVSTIEIAPRLHGADPDESGHLVPAALQQWRGILAGQ